MSDLFWKPKSELLDDKNKELEDKLRRMTTPYWQLQELSPGEAAGTMFGSMFEPLTSWGKFAASRMSYPFTKDITMPTGYSEAETGWLPRRDLAREKYEEWEAPWGVKGSMELAAELPVWAGIPFSGLKAFRAFGTAAKEAPNLAEKIVAQVGQVAVSPVALAEKGLELAPKAIYSPIKNLFERQLPEKTVTHTYEQLTQAHKLAKAKMLINKKTGNPTKTYRNLAELYTGKTSMKEMNRSEADSFIKALEDLESIGGKPPKIPKITSMVEKEFWDNIPILKDIGFVDYQRQKPKVLQMLGMKGFADDLLKAEVEALEEKHVFLQKLVGLKRSIRNDPLSKNRIFNSLENPIESHLLAPEEQEVYTYLREFFDSWANRLKIPEAARRKNYITHIFDEQVKQDIKAGKSLPLEVLKAMELNYPRTTYMPFLKQRIGKEIGLKLDPFAAAEVYESYALRKTHYEPLLQKLSAYINMFEARGKMTSANYLKDVSRRIAGRPSKEDILLNESMGKFAKTLSKMPGLKANVGLKLENLSSRGNLGALVAHNMASLYYMSWLGLRPVSAIRNLSQQLLAASAVGVDNFARGLGMRITGEGKAALKDSLVYRGRLLTQPVAGLEDDVLSRIPVFLQDKALAMFKWADKQNVIDSFLAGYAQGKKLGLPRDWCIKLGDEVAANTQYLYTKMSRSLFEDTTLGRFLTPFTSWPRNFMELMASWVQGRQSLVLQDYMKQTGKKLAIPKVSREPLYTYMALLTGAYITEGLTDVRAKEYTGWTSISTIGKMFGGTLPALELPGGMASIVSGALNADGRTFKEGINKVRPDRFVQIINQLENIAEGKQDILSLFLYLDRAEDSASILK